MKIKSNAFDFIIISLLCLFCGAILFPIMNIVAVSLSNVNEVLQGNVSLLPKGITLSAYKHILHGDLIPLAFWNTIKYTITGTLIGVFLTTLSSYPLAKKNLFGRKFFMKFILITMLFGAGLIPYYLLIVYLGIYNTIWALVLPGAINPFYIFMTVSFFLTIPKELEESAKIDGATIIRIFFTIIIPLSKPIVAALTLFYSMSYYNMYFTALIYLSDKSKYPLQIILQTLVIQNRTFMESSRGVSVFTENAEQSLKYATIVVSVIPVLMLYPFIQKYFVKGVMIGALKA